MSSKHHYFTTREATPLELQAQKVKRPENKPGRVVYLYLTLLFHVKNKLRAGKEKENVPANTVLVPSFPHLLRAKVKTSVNAVSEEKNTLTRF